MAKRGRPRKVGRKSFRTPQAKKLVREISSLATRLQKRIANVERLGLATYGTKQAKKIKTSVKGVSNRKLQSIRRKLISALQTQSTSVRGSKELQGSLGRISTQIGVEVDPTQYPKSWEEHRIKYKRYDKWIDEGFGSFKIRHSDKNYRYAVDELRTALIYQRKPMTKVQVLEMMERIKKRISAGDDFAVSREIDMIKKGKRSRYEVDENTGEVVLNRRYRLK